MSVLSMEKAREFSRLNAEYDKITWLDTGAKQESSLPVFTFILLSYYITDTWLRQMNK